MLWFRVLPRPSLASPAHDSPVNPCPLNSLPPLEISCLSFSHSRPFFSIACSLFPQNTRGGVSPFPPEPFRRTIDLHPLYFHTLVNPFFLNPFVFTNICGASCFFHFWGYLEHRRVADRVGGGVYTVKAASSLPAAGGPPHSKAANAAAGQGIRRSTDRTAAIRVAMRPQAEVRRRNTSGCPPCN